MEILPESVVDDFIRRRGPERAGLLAPLRSRLIPQSEPPDELELVVEPARWLLEQSGREGLWLDKDGLRRGFATRANSDLGFESPPFVHNQETFLEIDAIYVILAGHDAFVRVGRREVLSHVGHAYLGDPVALWHALVGGVGRARPPGFLGEMFECVLAWLIQDDLGYEHLWPVVEETASAHQIDPDAPDFEELLQVGCYSTYTFLRALSAFVPRDRDDPAKPRLRPAGRVAAVEALRVAAATPELITESGP